MTDGIDVEIAAAADECYARLCDVERVGEWVPGVAAVAVLERDGAGRVARARFTAMPARGSLAYELVYEYDDAARAVRWHSVEVELRDLRGEASFEPIAGGRTRMSYRFASASSDALPSWARAVFDEERAANVAYAFRRWLER